MHGRIQLRAELQTCPQILYIRTTNPKGQCFLFLPHVTLGNLLDSSHPLLLLVLVPQSQSFFSLSFLFASKFHETEAS
jgi:hypothetical protein